MSAGINKFIQSHRLFNEKNRKALTFLYFFIAAFLIKMVQPIGTLLAHPAVIHNTQTWAAHFCQAKGQNQSQTTIEVQ